MSHSAYECFWVALKLGCTSFGGPVAHVGFFRDEYVERLKWLTQERFAELMSLTQFLPGPSSSQLGAAVGYERAGWVGGLMAWLGFTLPSAIVMILFAMGMGHLGDWLGWGWLHGLKLAAVAVVAVAFLAMRKTLCKGVAESLMTVLALVVLAMFPLAWLQPMVILLGGIAGVFIFKKGTPLESLNHSANEKSLGVFSKLGAAVIAIVILVCVPMLFPENKSAMGLSSLFKAGALVFGGGHVVLPLLETGTVQNSLVEKETFLAGYGAAQAVPGPMFTFGSFLGASIPLFGSPWLGGIVGTLALFLPGMILLAGGLPVWNRLKNYTWAQSGVRGANATVVGVLGAALVGMFVGGSVANWQDAILVCVIFFALQLKLLPVWAVVIASGVIGGLIA